jgi:hypothetical protein
MNKNYLKDFVPYKQALELKKLGFDEPCLAKYYIDIAGETLPHFRYNNRINKAESIDEGVWFNHNLDKDHIWSAPTFFQAFRWFREKHGSFLFSDYGKFPHITIIQNLMFEYANLTYEEAELECLKKLIEIVKKQL